MNPEHKLLLDRIAQLTAEADQTQSFINEARTMTWMPAEFFEALSERQLLLNELVGTIEHVRVLADLVKNR